MVQLAHHHIVRLALPNLALVVADAEHLPIRSTTMDGVLCSSAIVWFPDIAQALREWQRLVCPGGWVAFSCFGGGARQTINTLVIELLRPYRVTYPELNTPLNTPDKCRTLVEAAGFDHVRVHTAQHQQFTTDPEASFAQAWGLARRFNIVLPPAEMDVIKAQYQVRFQALLANQERWNQDYEQFVVAYKPHATSSDRMAIAS
jgi:protein-L-isoaspartate(D-aspartate) O-methyltransferase